MQRARLQFDELEGSYSVCRLPAGSSIPDWIGSGGFVSVTRTGSELSILAETAAVPDSVQAERGWFGFRIAGTLDFSETGILADVTNILAGAGISVFVVSTFDTDYLFVPESQRDETRRSLVAAGHAFAGREP